MNLCEAIKIAHSQNKFVTNKELKRYGIKIEADKSQNWCNLIDEKKKTLTPRWEPGIDDFLNDTWIVVD